MQSRLCVDCVCCGGDAEAGILRSVDWIAIVREMDMDGAGGADGWVGR